MVESQTLETVIAPLLRQLEQQQEANVMQMKLNAELSEQNKELQQKISQLLSQVAWLNRQLFGRRSEKLAPFDPNQLSLFDEPTTPPLVDSTVLEETIVTLENEGPAKQPQKRKNREILDGLPTIEVVIEPIGIDLTKYKRIGEERTKTLEFEPGRLYVKETVRPKYGLRDNTTLPDDGSSTIVIAPLPVLPIYKGLPGASLLAEVLLQKYEYHVPFYRQQKQLKHLGLDIAESTLSGWFKPVCELLRPLYEELKKQILQSNYIQVDETTLPVINKELKKAAKEYLWVVRSVLDKQVFFYYDSGSRSQQTAAKLLRSFSGYLQSDGYSAYNLFEEKKEVCLVGCLAHIRRHFEKARTEHKVLADQALSDIQRLYRIEKVADSKACSFSERVALREELALPIIQQMEIWMEKTYPIVLPKSLIGKAIAYAYSIWPRMKVYIKEGYLNIDNNGAENAIRPIAISRKNFLFCGNHESAENTAIICSLLASCKQLDINPRMWLIDVLNKLPIYVEQKDVQGIQSLLPSKWIVTNNL